MKKQTNKQTILSSPTACGPEFETGTGLGKNETWSLVFLHLFWTSGLHRVHNNTAKEVMLVI